MRTLKCRTLQIGDLVFHEGKYKTVVSICLSHCQLTDKTWQELEELERSGKLQEFDYGNWIDLGEVRIME